MKKDQSIKPRWTCTGVKDEDDNELFIKKTGKDDKIIKYKIVDPEGGKVAKGEIPRQAFEMMCNYLSRNDNQL